MRPDVKYGIVVSAAIVLVGGLYFLFRDKGEPPVPVASGQQPPADAGAARTPSRTPSAPDARTAARPARKDTPGADSPASTPRRDAGTVKRTPPVRTSPPGTSAPGSAAPTAAPTAAPPPTVTPPTATTPAERTADAARRDVTAASPDAAKSSDAGRETTPPVAGPARTIEPSAAPPSEARTPTTAPVTEPERVALREEPDRPVPLAAVKPPVPSDAASSRVTAPPAVAIDTHRVQPGDTLSSLAQAYYGSTKYSQFLKQSNPDIANPDQLALGTVVRIPPRPEERSPDTTTPSAAEKPVGEKPTADTSAVGKPAAGKPSAEKATAEKPGTAKPESAKPSAESAAGRRTYTVKAGDSFYSIAKDVLGNASRWKEVYELNKAAVDGDPTHLRVGQVVVVPNK